MEITIGFTRTQQAYYYPMLEGYRAYATQDLISINLSLNLTGEADAFAMEVAEAVFIATNAPTEVIEAHPLAVQVWKALPFARCRALSIGDTVTFGGVTVACERLGWTRI
jgi:hypothetical protein